MSNVSFEGERAIVEVLAVKVLSRVKRVTARIGRDDECSQPLRQPTFEWRRSLPLSLDLTSESAFRRQVEVRASICG